GLDGGPARGALGGDGEVGVARDLEHLLDGPAEGRGRPGRRARLAPGGIRGATLRRRTLRRPAIRLGDGAGDGALHELLAAPGGAGLRRASEGGGDQRGGADGADEDDQSGLHGGTSAAPPYPKTSPAATQPPPRSPPETPESSCQHSVGPPPERHEPSRRFSNPATRHSVAAPPGPAARRFAP